MAAVLRAHSVGKGDRSAHLSAEYRRRSVAMLALRATRRDSFSGLRRIRRTESGHADR